MRLIFVFFLLPITILQGQEDIQSLKNTLLEAEKKYQVTYTFNDDLLSGYLAYEGNLPETLESFNELLKKEYLLTALVEINTIILSSISNSNIEICGYIKNDLEEKNFQNTLVIFGNRFTYSNNLGYFSFQNANPNLDQIIIKNPKIGVKKLALIRSENCPYYYLNSNEIDLDEVIVNYISPPISKNSKGTFRINLDKALSSPGSINPDIFELAKLLPGINDPNENNELYIRGGTPDQNQILWNGIRLYQNNHANGGLSSLNPYGIKKFEILIKGVPSSYGEQTAGLIVLDNYQNPNQSGWSSSFGIGLTDTDFVLNYKMKEKFETNISLRSSFNSTLSNTFESNTFNKLLSPLTNYNSVTDQTIYYNDFTLSSKIKINSDNSLMLQGFYLGDQINYELIQSDFEYKDNLNSRNFGMGLIWNTTFNDWKSSHHFSYTDFEMLFDRSLSQLEFDEEDQEYETEYSDLNKRDNHIKEIFFKTFHKKNKNNWYWGTDIVYRDVALSNLNIINQQERYITNTLGGLIFAAYTGSEFKFLKNNRLETGLRYNYFQNIKLSRIEPRINYILQLNSNWLLNSTFEIKSQSIYRTNETINFSNNYSYNLWTSTGDEFYPLLTVNQFSFGFTRKKQKTILEVDFYRKNINGITTFNFGYIDPNDQDFHVGKASILGTDVFFQRKWNQANLWLSYTYQDNQNKFDDLKGGNWYNSNFLIKHQLNLGGNLRLNNWEASVNYVIRSGLPYSQPSDVSLIDSIYVLQYDSLNDKFLPNYNRLDFSLSKRLILGDFAILDFKTSLKNLTNSENIIERIFFYQSSSQKIKYVDRISLVPFLNTGIRISLK